MIPTKEMIEQEPAGARMDAWVAEYVMKWKCLGRLSEDRPLTFETANGILRTRELTSYGQFKPSLDISNAWEVMEKLQRPDYSWDITSICVTNELQWSVYFTNWNGSWAGIASSSLCLAICKTALIWTLYAKKG